MTWYKLPKVSGVAHIIYDERTVENVAKYNTGLKVRQFRALLRKSGVIWNETHYISEKLDHYFEREIVKFEWYNLGKLPK